METILLVLVFSLQSTNYSVACPKDTPNNINHSCMESRTVKRLVSVTPHRMPSSDACRRAQTVFKENTRDIASDQKIVAECVSPYPDGSYVTSPRSAIDPCASIVPEATAKCREYGAAQAIIEMQTVNGGRIGNGNKQGRVESQYNVNVIQPASAGLRPCFSMMMFGGCFRD